MKFILSAIFSLVFFVGLVPVWAKTEAAKTKSSKPKADAAKTPETTALKTHVCELEEVGNKFYRVTFVDGSKSRYPDLKELYDAMNVKGSTLFEEIQKDQALPEGQQSLDLSLHIAKVAPVPFTIESKPKVGKGDRRCKDQTVTGYECRVNQFRDLGTTLGMPDGIHTQVTVRVAKNNPEFAIALTSQMGCEKTVLPSGAPLDFDEPMKQPVKLVPSGSGKTKP